MKDKFKSLQDCKIWDLVDLLKGCDPVKCHWVFDIKTDGHKKACIVAKGFSQCPGFDYNKTFSPVVRYETLHILLAWSVLKNWDIEALDVKTAFLYGDLDEEIYMQQPEGVTITVWTPTLCKPDMSDRPCYFLSTYLI
jgi:hypothetical protein